jgi:hypothetical protein
MRITHVTRGVSPGTIRDELRVRDGFFAKLFKAAHLKVGGGSVAVGAATALANFTFDVQSRPQLLEMGTVTVFMACSEADNVAGTHWRSRLPPTPPPYLTPLQASLPLPRRSATLRWTRRAAQ